MRYNYSPMARHPSSKQKMAEFRRNPVPLDGEAPSQSGNGQVQKVEKPAGSKRQDRRKYRRDYARWLWPYRWEIAWVFALAALIGGLDLVWPLAIKMIIDLLPMALPRVQKLVTLNSLG